MARPRKQQDEVAEPTGTVQARRKLERQRNQAARKLRALQVENTKAAQDATAKRLKAKPEDSRTLVEPDPAAGIL